MTYADPKVDEILLGVSHPLLNQRRTIMEHFVNTGSAWFVSPLDGDVAAQ